MNIKLVENISADYGVLKALGMLVEVQEADDEQSFSVGLRTYWEAVKRTMGMGLTPDQLTRTPEFFIIDTYFLYRGDLKQAYADYEQQLAAVSSPDEHAEQMKQVREYIRFGIGLGLVKAGRRNQT